MLGEAHRRLARGTDVVVGFVETHNRPQTAAMISGLEVVPRRSDRAPRGALRGDGSRRGARPAPRDRPRRRARPHQRARIAHTTSAGRTSTSCSTRESTSSPRSTSSTSSRSTTSSRRSPACKQRETVPDSVVRAADQIELVDMSPESLRRRLAHGNVYAPEKVDAALGQLLPGREPDRAPRAGAALGRGPRRGGSRALPRRSRHRGDLGGPPAHRRRSHGWARERILAPTRCDDRRPERRVGCSSASTSIRGDGTIGARPDDIARLRQLTEDLSGTFHTVVGDDVATAVLDFARSVNGTQVVVGASRRSRLSMALRQSHADQIVRHSGDIDVHVVTHDIAAEARPTRTEGRRHHTCLARGSSRSPSRCSSPWRCCPSATGCRSRRCCSPSSSASSVRHLSAACRRRSRPLVVASLLANWFFVPPYGELTISEPENAFALVVFLAVARCRRDDRGPQRGGDEGGGPTPRRGERPGVAVGGRPAAWGGRARPAGPGLRDVRNDRGRALRVRGRRSGPATRIVEVSGASPPASVEAAAVVADAGSGLVLALSGSPLPAADRRMLDAFAAQAAAVLERDRLTTRAADAVRLSESDAVRTALLAAVSHDLRTPLAGIKASIATARDPELDLSADDLETLLGNAADSADRLDALLENLLDLSRLQTGSVRPLLAPVSLDEVLYRARHGVPSEAVVDETDDTLPLVLTDAGLLERAVANLVENAVRYSPNGVPVRLTAGVVARWPAPAPDRRPRTGRGGRGQAADVRGIPTPGRRSTRHRGGTGRRRRPRPGRGRRRDDRGRGHAGWRAHDGGRAAAGDRRDHPERTGAGFS